MGDGGGRQWLVRMEWHPAGWSVCLPLLIFTCTIKFRSSLLAPAQPGGPGKRAIKRLWWWWNGKLFNNLWNREAIQTTYGISDSTLTAEYTDAHVNYSTITVLYRDSNATEWQRHQVFFTNLSHHRLPSGLRTDSTALWLVRFFWASPFFIFSFLH